MTQKWRTLRSGRVPRERLIKVWYYTAKNEQTVQGFGNITKQCRAAHIDC